MTPEERASALNEIDVQLMAAREAFVENEGRELGVFWLQLNDCAHRVERVMWDDQTHLVREAS